MERSKPGEFNWIDLSARDFDAQSAFYERLFGWGHTDIVPPVAELEALGIPSAEGMTYRMFNSGGHNVGGMSQLSPDLIAQGMPSAWNTYVATDDVDAAAAVLDAVLRHDRHSQRVLRRLWNSARPSCGSLRR